VQTDLDTSDINAIVFYMTGNLYQWYSIHWVILIVKYYVSR
jgi:hypothetical protein